VYRRLRAVAVLPEPVRLSAWAARQAGSLAEPAVSVQQARQRAEPGASAEPVRQRAEPGVLAEPVLQPEARVASAQQAAAQPLEERDAAVVQPPAADAVGAAPGARVVRRPEARRALVAQVLAAAAGRDAAEQDAAEQLWGAPQVLPWAVLSALAFRRDRLRSAPAPPPAVRFARATTGLQIASQ
jgi:hypothetical protein